MAPWRFGSRSPLPLFPRYGQLMRCARVGSLYSYPRINLHPMSSARARGYIPTSFSREAAFPRLISFNMVYFFISSIYGRKINNNPANPHRMRNICAILLSNLTALLCPASQLYRQSRVPCPHVSCAQTVPNLSKPPRPYECSARATSIPTGRARRPWSVTEFFLLQREERPLSISSHYDWQTLIVRGEDKETPR
mgnify:CR=1 FL=1